MAGRLRALFSAPPWLFSTAEARANNSSSSCLSRNATKRHDSPIFASHFRDRVDLKNKSHLESGLNQRDEATQNVPFKRPNKCLYTPSTRMEIRTWRSAIADLKGSSPGAPSGALGEGTPGWVWRCDAAISRYHHAFLPFCAFFTCSQNTKMTLFSLISKVFGHV